MKVMLEIPSELLTSAEEAAETRGTTLSFLVEEGLRRVLSDYVSAPKPEFRLADRRVHGKPRALHNSIDLRGLDDSLVLERFIRSANGLTLARGLAPRASKSRKP